MDHTSDPNAFRNVFDPTRIELACEFRDRPSGPHSRDLNRLLNFMRWSPRGGRYALLVIDPGKRWQLARIPLERGKKVELFDLEFNSLNAAEWHVFKLRWLEIAGVPLKLD
jgi:hypothetical protein